MILIKKFVILAALMLLMNLIVPVSASERPIIQLREVTAQLHQDKTMTVSEHLVIDGTNTNERELYIHDDDTAVQRFEDIEIISDQALIFNEGNMIKIADDQLTEVVLNYTIQYFADNDPDMETVNFEFGENLFDLETEKLKVTVTPDEGLVRDNWKLVCNGSSHDSCRYGDGRWKDQSFVFENKETVKYAEIELQMSFFESMFTEVPEYEWPAHFEYRYMDIEMDKDRNMHVRQEFKMTRMDKERLDMELYPGWPNFPEAVLENVVFSDSLLENSRYGYVELPTGMPLEMSVEYDVIVKKQTPSFRIDMQQFSTEASVDDLRISVHLPESFSYDISSYDTITYQDAEEIDIQVSDEGKEILITNNAPVRGNVRLTLDMEVPVNKNLFSFAGMSMFFQMLAAGLAIVSFLLRGLSRVKLPRQTGDLPENINPMTAALLSGRKAETDQIAAVIMNWAAQGYVRVLHKDNRVLLQFVNLPYGSSWEEELMRDLFALGDGDVVDLNEISLRGYKPISKAMDAATHETRSMYFNKGMEGLILCILVLSALPPLVCSLMAFRMTYEPAIALTLSILLILLTVVIGLISHRMKRGRNKITTLVAAGFIWFILFTLTLNEYMDFEGGMAVCYIGMLIVHCTIGTDLSLTKEGMLQKRSVDLWKKDFHKMNENKLDECMSLDRDYAARSYSYAWSLGCDNDWNRNFSHRIVPPVDFVIDENGSEQQIWVLDELREQLILCCRAR